MADHSHPLLLPVTSCFHALLLPPPPPGAAYQHTDHGHHVPTPLDLSNWRNRAHSPRKCQRRPRELAAFARSERMGGSQHQASAASPPIFEGPGYYRNTMGTSESGAITHIELIYLEYIAFYTPHRCVIPYFVDIQLDRLYTALVQISQT
ncbi:hypothetical protein F4604DRAFT_1898971 [Suillus subluteus]|nr:hypothetical protein F4604DRAFT_1898971 [Suillus subluteus]